MVIINSPIIAQRSFRQPSEEQQFGAISLGFLICRFGLVQSIIFIEFQVLIDLLRISPLGTFSKTLNLEHSRF